MKQNQKAHLFVDVLVLVGLQRLELIQALRLVDELREGVLRVDLRVGRRLHLAGLRAMCAVTVAG
jgi:hypothetical protein